jgi:hypothetical protein
VVAGLTLDELAGRTARDRRWLRLALRDEVELGRVSCQDGRFALCPGSPSPHVAEALAGLSATDVADEKR